MTKTHNRHGRLLRHITTAGVLLTTTAYAIGPFLTLWCVSRAAQNGDLASLQSLVDWEAIRQGLKDDIAEGLIGMPAPTLAAENTLPPFGASFVAGIAGSEIDRAVTPQALLDAARQSAPLSPFPAIVAAAFRSPTEFDLRLRAATQEADEPPLHLRLIFRGGLWQVARVWLPQDMIDRAIPPGSGEVAVAGRVVGR